MQGLGHAVDFPDKTVDAITDAQAVFHRLDEHIAGLGHHRLLDDRIGQGDDRRFFTEILNGPLIRLSIVFDQLQAFRFFRIFNILKNFLKVRRIIVAHNCAQGRRAFLWAWPKQRLPTWRSWP